MIPFQRNGFQLLEKDIPELRTIYISKRPRRNLKLQVVKNKCFKKREVRVYSPEEACMKFGQTERKLRPSGQPHDYSNQWYGKPLPGLLKCFST